MVEKYVKSFGGYESLEHLKKILHYWSIINEKCMNILFLLQ